MHNWNFDEAVERVESITDPTARRLTRLFLDAAVLQAVKKASRPEGEFDLAFFIHVVSQVTVHETELLRRVLDGENIDAGWEALNDALAADPPQAMGR
jgi:hypothetical protein